MLYFICLLLGFCLGVATIFAYAYFKTKKKKGVNNVKKHCKHK